MFVRKFSVVWGCHCISVTFSDRVAKASSLWTSMCMNVGIDGIPSTFSDGLFVVLIRQFHWEIEICDLLRIQRVATIEVYAQAVCFVTLWENEESPGEEERHKSTSERLIRWSGLIDSTLLKGLGICKIKWGSAQVMTETKAVYIHSGR